MCCWLCPKGGGIGVCAVSKCVVLRTALMDQKSEQASHRQRLALFVEPRGNIYMNHPSYDHRRGAFQFQFAFWLITCFVMRRLIRPPFNV